MGVSTTHRINLSMWILIYSFSDTYYVWAACGKRWKTTIGLISKSNFARAAHLFFCTFLCRCFARLQRETSRNFLVTRFMEEMSYVFPFTFFSAHFHLALVAASISHFVTAATKFSCFSSNKKMSPLFFISRSKSLSPFFSLSFACLPPTFSFSLSFSCSIFEICGHDNLSKLNTLDNTDTETISAFCFRLYWLFVVSALQDAGGYAISRQNNLELYLGYHTCWLSNLTLVYLWCGRTVSRAVGVRSRDYQIFSDGQIAKH